MRVFLTSPDLLFRSKLRGTVTARGGVVASDPAACDLAVLALEVPGALDRLRALAGAGVPVIAYASHVRADLLRAAREAGAVAVPNSEVEHRLAAVLTSPPPSLRSDGDGPSRPSGA